MKQYIKRAKQFIQSHPQTFRIGSLVVLCIGLYLLALTVAPIQKPKPLKSLPPVLAGEETDPRDQTRKIPKNRIIIPKISADYRIFTGEDWALNLGVWHRFPDRGDPERGGNFILSAHRFKLDWTPQKTRALSPFYHIDKLTVGDEIIIDFKGKRYTYKVTKIHQVAPTQVEIEAPTDEARMTLYSCTLKGAADGRLVVEATLSS